MLCFCLILFTASTCAFYCSVFLFSYPHTTQGTLPPGQFLGWPPGALLCWRGWEKCLFSWGPGVLPVKYCVFLSALPTLASQIKLLLAILAELTALGLFWPPHYLIWKCIIKYIISCCHCECIFITKLKNNIMIFST